MANARKRSANASRRNYLSAIGFPFTSSCTIGAIFVAASGAFDLRAIADDHDRQVIGVDVLLRDANHVVLRHGVDRARELLVVVLRQPLRVDRRDAAVDAARPTRSSPAGSARGSPSPAPSRRRSADAGRGCRAAPS